MSEKVEDIEVLTIAMNAMDDDNGPPLFQLMTPDPSENPLDFYIRANPEGSRPHTISADGGSLLPKGGHKGCTLQWSGGGGDQTWKYTGWKEGKGPWTQRPGNTWDDTEGNLVDYKETSQNKDFWKDSNASSSSKAQ